MAFLQRIVNGGGSIAREMAVYVFIFETVFSRSGSYMCKLYYRGSIAYFSQNRQSGELQSLQGSHLIKFSQTIDYKTNDNSRSMNDRSRMNIRILQTAPSMAS